MRIRVRCVIGCPVVASRNYSLLAGYEDVNDAERLPQDPTFRLIGSEKIWGRGAPCLRK